MANCGCILSRNVLRASSLITNHAVYAVGRHNLHRMPIRALSCTPRRLVADSTKDSRAKQNQEQFNSQQTDSSSSSSDSDGFSQSSVGEDEEYEHSIRQRILQASLEYVPVHGWTKQALEAGAQSEGLPPVAQGMFPRGGGELVHYFYAKCNTELADILNHQVEQKEEGAQKPSGTAFIRDALETRLRMIGPYLDSWPQAMAIQALPVNAVDSWTNLLRLSDEIWYHAGDRSVDFNWYTKRVALAGVYKSSEIYMLQDKSPDLENTWAFMDRRLQDFQSFGGCKKKLELTMCALKEGLEGSCIMGRNILGMNSRNR